MLAYVLFMIDLFGKKHVFRWDLFAIVLTAGIVKVAVYLWYRFTD